MVRVYISIGSNIEREANIRSAIAELRRCYGRLLISPIYENEAVGFDGDAFYNGVLGLDTEADVLALNARLRSIEESHGRRRGQAKFCSRSLDLDLLTWGDRVLCDGGLVLPRPEILEQAYVLRPLADIAGAERHPQDGRTLQELWSLIEPDAPPMHPVQLDLGREAS